MYKQDGYGSKSQSVCLLYLIVWKYVKCEDFTHNWYTVPETVVNTSLMKHTRVRGAIAMTALFITIWY